MKNRKMSNHFIHNTRLREQLQTIGIIIGVIIIVSGIISIVIRLI